MVGYSEVLQTIAAMLVFSLILLNANRMIQRNNVMQLESEFEQEIIAIAQDIIDEARSKEFDEESIDFVPVNIPNDFTSSADLGPETGENGRQDFDDFDDYDGWTTTFDTEHGDDAFSLSVRVFYVDGSFNATGGKTAYKKIEVTLQSPYLKKTASNDLKDYTFDFVRNYYAD